jgi:hypothetical protein
VFVSGHQRHRSTEWIKDVGTLVVFAEVYATDLRPSQTFTVGWTAQQVRYKTGSMFHLGPFCPAALASHKTLEKHSESRLFYIFAHLRFLSSDSFSSDSFSSLPALTTVAASVHKSQV